MKIQFIGYQICFKFHKPFQAFSESQEFLNILFSINSHQIEKPDNTVLFSLCCFLLLSIIVYNIKAHFLTFSILQIIIIRIYSKKPLLSTKKNSHRKSQHKWIQYECGSTCTIVLRPHNVAWNLLLFGILIYCVGIKHHWYHEYYWYSPGNHWN